MSSISIVYLLVVISAFAVSSVVSAWLTRRFLRPPAAQIGDVFYDSVHDTMILIEDNGRIQSGASFGKKGYQGTEYIHSLVNQGHDGHMDISAMDPLVISCEYSQRVFRSLIEDGSMILMAHTDNVNAGHVYATEVMREIKIERIVQEERKDLDALPEVGKPY